MSDVKVYLWDGDCTECGGAPYFMLQPMSPTGDWRDKSERQAFTVPEETFARWRGAVAAAQHMQDEIRALLRQPQAAPKPCPGLPPV